MTHTFNFNSLYFWVKKNLKMKDNNSNSSCYILVKLF